MQGQNSRAFLRIPWKWARLRALMLCRELTRPTVATVNVRLAAHFSRNEVTRLERSGRGGQKARAYCYLRADRDIPRPKRGSVKSDTVPPIDFSSSARTVKTELERLSERSNGLIGRHGAFDLIFFKGDSAPSTLRALGRARETTFRAAGQGTEKECDLSPEDEYYHHLVLWDRNKAQLAGAYRLGMVQEILDARGPSALYLDHVFKIQPALYRKLGNAFELSRSFVTPEYQRDSGALAGLWKKLGGAAALHEIETFFGSVTISNDHHPVSRATIVEYLRQNHADTPDMCGRVKARKPFRFLTRYHRMIAEAFRGEPIGNLSSLIEGVEGGERGIFPLIRYYCSLGAKFLDFHVEADFQDALYCLLRVEIAKIPEAYRRRFMPASHSLCK
ncbi:MAG: lysophospholipid acyltransferase family protein [Opitutales bacterium]